MNIIWGYTPSEEKSKTKTFGKEIKEVKQLFSALLFKQGISGICVKIDALDNNPEVEIKLVVDNTEILSFVFLPTTPKNYSVEMDEVIIPESKIEVVLSVIHGAISLPISSVGTGMGFQKVKKQFVPTSHLGLGLIIP